MTQPDLSTLPQRMREAAATIDEYIRVTPSLHSGEKFAATNLRIAADRLHERVRRQVDALAAEMFAANCEVEGGRYAGPISDVEHIYKAIARKLIESGWGKATDGAGQ